MTTTTDVEETAIEGPNIALLDETLAYIEAHPEEWDQSVWRCDTGMCFAGTAAMLAGATFPYAADDDGPAPGFFYPATASELVKDDAGELRMIEDFAGARLNLTEDEEDVLFAGGNDLADIRRAIGDIKRRAYR